MRQDQAKIYPVGGQRIDETLCIKPAHENQHLTADN
jgi:hypothetical protein